MSRALFVVPPGSSACMAQQAGTYCQRLPDRLALDVAGCVYQVELALGEASGGIELRSTPTGRYPSACAWTPAISSDRTCEAGASASCFSTDFSASARGHSGADLVAAGVSIAAEPTDINADYHSDKKCIEILSASLPVPFHDSKNARCSISVCWQRHSHAWPGETLASRVSAPIARLDPGVYVRILRVHGTPGHVIIPTFDERRAG
jgi:hypothetical protein